MSLKTIKTDEFTIVSGHLETGDGHQVWYEQWGSQDAEIPILQFHGGPGGESKPKYKYNFDPKKHQVIGFDQRGSGNSLPYGSIENNTTHNLINDAVKILETLGVKKVHIFGGSWGSTLSLLFAIKHPTKTETVQIRGVFTGNQDEIDWLDKGYFAKHFPEVWDRFVASVPKEFKDNPAEYHYGSIASGDEIKVSKAAKALEDLEMPILGFDWSGYPVAIKSDPDPNAKEEEFDAVPYKIYGHYFRNGCFLEPNYILDNAHKITAPLYIVQGRYDMACPPITAYKIHKAVKGSKLYMTLASHGNDPETRTATKVLIDSIYN